MMQVNLQTASPGTEDDASEASEDRSSEDDAGNVSDSDSASGKFPVKVCICLRRLLLATRKR